MLLRVRLILIAVVFLGVLISNNFAEWTWGEAGAGAAR